MLGRLAANRRFQRAVLIGTALFVVANGVTWLAYQGRTYPNTIVADHNIGSLSKDELPKKLQALTLLPKEVRFVQAKQSTAVNVASLGVKADINAIASQAMQARSWLPVANLVGGRQVTLSFANNSLAVQNALSASLAAFQQTAADAKIDRKSDGFAIKADTAGQAVDAAATRQRLLAALQSGQTSVTVATKRVGATITAASLKKPLSELNSQSKTTVKLRYSDKTKQFSVAEITSWYTETEGAASMSLSDAAVQAAVSSTGAGFGIRVQNLAAVIAAIKAGLQAKQAVDITLEAAPAGKRLTYCTAVRGVNEAELSGLATKLTETFADSRGWGLGGLVQFQKVEAGCDFTVWLSAADQMPTFGAICDAEWSCAVSPNVVINYDRWRYASSAWNNQGGSLPDYRAMVINHETGHWLGYYHSDCPGAGQQAPVMQQQSIDLQGCSFNPWPTVSEQASLQRKFGL